MEKIFLMGTPRSLQRTSPSSTVDKIQVLKNFGEVGQLRGVRNNQNNVAINIKLKEGKESFWFGNITAGGGNSPTEDRYLLQPKLFYYSPKYTINFIGDLNNIGEVALSRRDLRGFGGGFRPPSSQSGTNINLGDNSLNFLTDQSDALNIENKLGTANFSYSPNKNLDLSGFLIYNYNKTTSKANSFIQYTDAVLQIPDEEIDQSSTENSHQSLVKLSASYKPNIDNQIDYDVFIRTTNDSQNQNILSSLIGSTSEIRETTPYSINQNLNYYFTLDEKNIFAFEAQHLFKNEDPFYNAVLVNDPSGLDAFDNYSFGFGIKF